MKRILTLIGLAAGLTAAAQDVHFTQYFTSPLTLNPANTGLVNCDWRVSGNYRDQWSSVNSTGYQTATISYDMAILRGKLNGDALGIGILGLYLERPVADIIKQRWVQQYALALAKISIGQIRTKFGTVTLFGGGQINGTDLLSQGLEEKQRLEDEILKTYGADQTPPMFFIG